MTAAAAMFEGFTQRRIDCGAAGIDLLTAGSGPPLLLLHGFPQTRAAWHLVAPALASDFMVIVPDLRGYGDSPGPVPDAAGVAYGKRAMAADMVAVLDALGYRRVAVAGHDRGGRVGYRLALDHPERVSALAVLDIMTTLDTWEAMDWRAALAAYHWPLLAQEARFVEAMIGADPAAYLDHLLDRWIGRGSTLHPAARAAYHAAFGRPEVRAAMAADYRAGAGIDADLDRADRQAGRRIACPILLLRGSQYESRPLAPPWSRWGTVAGEQAFDCGHFLAEEAPEQVSTAIRDFLMAV